MTQQHPGPLPAGMLRINQGHKEHYVWPVHLPGWLLLGWRVAGSANAPAALPETLEAEAVAPDPGPEVMAELDGAQPTTGRGKRGRRRKEEEHPHTVEKPPAAIGTAAEEKEKPTAAVETTPAVIGIAAEESNAASDPPASSESTDSRSSTELAANTSSEPAAAAPAAEEEVALSALPDDLFDDPLI